MNPGLDDSLMTRHPDIILPQDPFADEDTSPVEGPDSMRGTGIDSLLARYIRLANQRDLDGLLELYTENPTISLEGRPMGRDLNINMRRAVRAWKDVHARFEKVRVRSLRLNGDSASVDFMIPSRGRLFAFSKRFDFHKHVELTRNGTHWRIASDDTREAGIVGKVMSLAGVL